MFGRVAEERERRKRRRGNKAIRVRKRGGKQRQKGKEGRRASPGQHSDIPEFSRIKCLLFLPLGQGRDSVLGDMRMLE